MTIEIATFINGLNPLGPGAADPKSEGDDHIRLLKSTIKNTFPAITGAVTPTHTELNYVAGVTSGIQLQFNAVQGQFSAVQGQFVAQTAATATKGAITGQTWTGTHDFTGGVLRAATPVGPSDVATMLYAQQYAQSLAFSSALPAIAGNAGKIITNNGTVASWDERTVTDSIAIFKGSVDPTKRVRFSAAGLTTGTERVISAPDRSGTMALLDDAGFKLLAPAIVPTAVSTIDINVFAAPYNNILIYFNGLNVAGAAGDQSIRARFLVAGAPDAGNNYAQLIYGATGASFTSELTLSTCNAAFPAVGGQLVLQNVNSTGIKSGDIRYTSETTASGVAGQAFWLRYKGATAISGIRIYTSAGTFAAQGQIEVYGCKST